MRIRTVNRMSGACAPLWNNHKVSNKACISKLGGVCDAWTLRSKSFRFSSFEFRFLLLKELFNDRVREFVSTSPRSVFGG